MTKDNQKDNECVRRSLGFEADGSITCPGFDLGAWNNNKNRKLKSSNIDQVVNPCNLRHDQVALVPKQVEIHE